MRRLTVQVRLPYNQQTIKDSSNGARASDYCAPIGGDVPAEYGRSSFEDVPRYAQRIRMTVH
jgi:hypothetical protein